MVVFGLKPDGAWDYWFGTQQGTYHALKLPAEMRVCASGEGVNVREQPDAGSPAVGQLSDGATVTAERFVLTEPGKIQPSLVSGNGWYQVSGSLSGYIRADFLSVTSLPDCSLHDILIG